MRLSPRRALPFASLAALLACGVPTWQPGLIAPEAAPAGPSQSGRPAPLKVHMVNGDLYVLDTWAAPDDTGPLTGFGTRFGQDRVPVGTGEFRIPRGDIALLETNRRETVSRFAYSGLVVYTAMWGAVTVACLADPKSCFGSCPTFYGEDPDRPLAEGFSSSFARALEASDVDMLGLRRPPGPMSLTMRNEAQETQAVRRVRLLGVDPQGAGTILRDPDGRFFGARSLHAPTLCDAGDTDCLEGVAAFDDVEYAPRTDPDDLAAREEVLLRFDETPVGAAGLVLGARQSLVSTFVFYQTMAYAGSAAGELLASLERGAPGAKESVLAPARALGGVEAFVRTDDGGWVHLGDFAEAGPIAADRIVLPLPPQPPGPVEVKLRMARGSWRLDWVAVAGLTDELRPVVLPLDSVAAEGADGRRAHGRLTDPDAHLVTTPGDEHRLWFTVPPGPALELFLDTEGYYYEWMRGEWLAEEDPTVTALLLTDPERALRMLAPAFKRREGAMEDLFWASRFRRP